MAYELVREASKTGAVCWSQYQLDFYDAVESTEDSLLVEAVAGSGKTTSSVEAVSRVPRGKTIKFLAFGKAIATTLNTKFRERGMSEVASTFHALGWAAWRRAASLEGACEIAKGSQYAKTLGIMDEMVERGSLSRQDRWKYSGQMGKLISLAKGAGIVPEYTHTMTPTNPYPSMCAGLVADTDETWLEIIDHYGLDADEINLELARKVLAESIAIGKDLVDFDDMQFLPLITGVSWEKFDVVFVDESQDVAPIQLEILTRIAKRVIAVGDKNQSIFGFRGAHAEAMDLIQQRFQCRRLPLSISYRCPKAVVLWARQWVPEIEYAEGAKDGYVGEAGTDWTGQANIALGAPLESSRAYHQPMGEGIPASSSPPAMEETWVVEEEFCLCGHSEDEHDSGCDRCLHREDEVRCGCLSFIERGEEDVTVMVDTKTNKARKGSKQTGGPVLPVALDGQGEEEVGGERVRQLSNPSRGRADGVSKFRGYLEDFQPGDGVLCRVNRPLVSLAFRLIRARVPTKVLGRDIGQGLVVLVKKLQGKSGVCSLQELQVRIDRYRAKETERLTRRKEYAAVGVLEDKLGTLETFMEEAEDVEGLLREIEGMFGEDVGGVVLSSIHKAKGLEYDRVFILDAQQYQPSPWARQGWEQGQERNLQYVAATRAKAELRYISSEEIR